MLLIFDPIQIILTVSLSYPQTAIEKRLIALFIQKLTSYLKSFIPHTINSSFTHFLLEGQDLQLIKNS